LLVIAAISEVLETKMKHSQHPSMLHPVV